MSTEQASRRIMLDDVRMTPFLRRVTIFSGGGPFLDGYVLSLIGVALVPLSAELHLSTAWTSAIGVAALVGLFLGTAIGGYVTDRIGRKKMFLIDIVAIAVLSIGSAFVSEAWMVFALRFLIGIAIGADYPIATSLIAEFTPRRYRAISMGFIAAIWYVGANVAYVVGYFLQNAPGSWRWMLASSAVPCIVILIGRWDIPESPRWLARHGQRDKADAIVRRIFGADVELEAEPPARTKYSLLFRNKAYLSKVVFVGTIWLCQAVPMFAVYTYGPQLMEGFGVGGENLEFLSEIAVGTAFMIGCIPAMFWANSLGRRRLIIGSFAMMTLAMGVLGVLSTPTTWVMVICLVAYAFFSGGPGNLQWLYPNELFPTEIRASAVGAAMAFSRIGTVVTTYVLPWFLETYGMQATMVAFTVFSALGLAVSVLMAPETRGLTLTQSARLELAHRGGPVRQKAPT